MSGTKKLICIIAFSGFFLSCQKQKCRDQRDIELKNSIVRFQKQVANPNLTQSQINGLIRRFEAEQKKIREKCK